VKFQVISICVFIYRANNIHISTHTHLHTYTHTHTHTHAYTHSIGAAVLRCRRQ